MVLDKNRLQSITQGDEGLARRIAELYQQTGQSCVQRLAEQAEHNADQAAWHDTCHELKGASANIGAVAVQKACAEAENCAKEERQHWVAMIQQALVATNEELQA